MYSLAKALEEITPDISTIQHPLIYKLSKNDRTHYLVGSHHYASLSQFPKECRDLFQQCQSLITETMVKLPLESLQKYGLINQGHNYFIGKKLGNFEQAFLNDMQEIFAHLELVCPVKAVSPVALFEIWACVKGMKMDDALVKLAKELKIPIVSLNPMEVWLKNWNERVSSLFYSEDCFCSTFSQNILDYYRNNGQLNPYVQHELDIYLQEEINHNRLPANKVEELSSINQAWLQLFTNEHEQGKNNILMACGYEHVFGENGLLKGLKEQGFCVEKFTPGSGFQEEVQSKRTFEYAK